MLIISFKFSFPVSQLTLPLKGLQFVMLVCLNQLFLFLTLFFFADSTIEAISHLLDLLLPNGYLCFTFINMSPIYPINEVLTRTQLINKLNLFFLFSLIMVLEIKVLCLHQL